MWFLLAWKERLLDIVVKIEKRRKVISQFFPPMYFPASLDSSASSRPAPELLHWSSSFSVASPDASTFSSPDWHSREPAGC